jgi:PTH2 family peptidyl-tRNA hydrolase
VDQLRESHKQVLVVRTDLNMRKGKMIAQGAHASLKALLDSAVELNAAVLIRGRFLAIELEPRVEAWLKGLFTKIAVGVGSEAELLAIYEKAKAAGMLTALIQDSGKTEFGGVKTYTCVAVGPDENAKVDAITGHLKLL